MAKLPIWTILIVILVPLSVLLSVTGSIYIFWHRRARRRSHSIREITSPTSRIDEERKVFGGFRSPSLGAGFKSTAPSSSTFQDQEKKRWFPFRRFWRWNRKPQISLESDAFASPPLTSTLPASPVSDGVVSPWFGKHSSHSSPLLGSLRSSKNPASGSKISLPRTSVGCGIPSVPIAWQADGVFSDGSDRATPSPLTPRILNTARFSSPCIVGPGLGDATPHPAYYDPWNAARRMHTTFALPAPLASQPHRSSPYSIDQRINADLAREVTMLPTMVEESEPSSRHMRTRSQTMTSVTTIRSSFDSVVGDWQREEMPQMPRLHRSMYADDQRLHRSMYSVEDQRRRDRQRQRPY